MAIDKTKRPLKIPPQFQLYAEEHGLFDLYHRMLQQLIIDKPEDPLEYMINWFKRESDPVPKIAVIGPPSSGRHSVAQTLSEKLGAVLVKASPHAKGDDEIVSELTNRLRAPGSEPVRRGYILEDLPKNKRQALLLQQNGISMEHILLLDAPENILLGRRTGKYQDSETHKTYHKLYNWPDDPEIQERLNLCSNANREDFEKDLVYWKREKIGILEAYKNANIVRTVNADQPLVDVAGHCLKVAQQPNRSEATIIPRLILLGAKGSGKETVANFLCDKYKMVKIDVEKLIKIVSNDRGSSTGDAIRTCLRENEIDINNDDYKNPAINQMPDQLLVRLVSDRISRMDCQTNGWCLYNFPKNFSQVEALNMMGHRPNKVFSLELPLETAIERLSNRMLDPVTGTAYHKVWNPPESLEIMKRLVVAPYDDEEVISYRFNEFNSTINSIKKVYLEQEKQHEKVVGGIFININADQDLTTVLEYCESMLVNPIPNSS